MSEPWTDYDRWAYGRDYCLRCNDGLLCGVCGKNCSASNDCAVDGDEQQGWRLMLYCRCPRGNRMSCRVAERHKDRTGWLQRVYERIRLGYQEAEAKRRAN